MLKQLFTSNTRIKLLGKFLLNQKSEYFIRELTRILDEQINSIRRELDNLKTIGLLKTKVKNRKKYYCLNTEFILLDELTSIFTKLNETDKKIARDIENLGTIKLLIQGGVFVNDKENSKIDMLLVGSIDKEKLMTYLNGDIGYEKPIRFAVLTEDDYKYRLNCNDQFIYDVINNPKNIKAIDKIDKN